MKFSGILLVLTLFLVMMACQQKRETDNGVDATQLFNQSAELMIEMTNQIRNATDSSMIDSLSKLYEKRVIDINFSFPPQTDLKLSEQDNDSLFKLANQLLETKSLKLKGLSIVEPDSVLN